MIFFLLLLFVGFLLDLSLSKVSNNVWNLIVGIEWTISRSSVILIYILLFNIAFIWEYIIITLYFSVSVLAFIDLDYLKLRALIPDFYYIIMALPYESYIIFIAILLPMLIKLYYYIYIK